MTQLHKNSDFFFPYLKKQTEYSFLEHRKQTFIPKCFSAKVDFIDIFGNF